MASPGNGWTTVAFGDVVQLNKERVQDPLFEGLDRCVGLEHLEPGDLKIRRWGNVVDGTTFTNVFRPGQVLFGKRRAYQRKVAMADFSGVCSGDIYVLRPKDDRLLPELLPFICQTDSFIDHAVGTSAGSLSPRTNWKSLASYVFALPPLEEQRRIAGVLQAAEGQVDALVHLSSRIADLYRSSTSALFANNSPAGVRSTEWAPRTWVLYRMEELVVPEAPICYGIVQVGEFDPDGVPTLAINSIANSAVDHVHRTSRSIERKFKRSRVTAGDVVVSIKGTVGLAGIVPVGFSGNISRDVARLRLDRSRVLPSLFLHLWSSPRFQGYLRSLIVGTTRAELSIAALRNLEVPTPPISEQHEILEQLQALSAAGTAAVGHLSRCRRSLASMTNRLVVRGTK